MNRINFLDGFRGLAILMVVFYHTFSRWTSLVPYKDEFANFPLFNKGWLGVQLFFLISGFVILMTLEKNKNFIQFIYKRWLRLFPAMLISTIFIFSTLYLLPERPFGISNLSSVIPGLIFTEPSWIKIVTHNDVGVLEGTFWSLFVEVKYYFIFGILYYIFGKYKAILGVFVFYLIWLGSVVFKGFVDIRLLNLITENFSFKYFGWFTTGSLTYLYYVSKQNKYLICSFITGFTSIFSISLLSFDTVIAIIIILLIFIATVYFDNLKKIFANKLFLFFGFISYPLYLIHENALIALIIKTQKQFHFIPNIALPIIPLAILVFIAYLIAKVLEPEIHKLIKKINILFVF
jgi:peptidoglycan/LPS O-acetylase OafA/YrhL